MTRTEFSFVVDTKVIVSALLFRSSVAWQCFDKVLHHGSLLQSHETTNELDQVLRREKFSTYVTEVERLEFLGELVAVAKFIHIVETVHECRDSKDDKFLELAINGSAYCIVSGDQALQAMTPFRDIPIISPINFLALNLETT